MIKTNLAALRKNYAQKTLGKDDVASSPFAQFSQWFSEALEAQILEPNAMILATANRKKQPSARTVLLKELDEQGFVFYTNFESKKGNDLAENPQAALLFLWLDLERQIRIEGKIEKVSQQTAAEYFQSRPKMSQIGAWASAQSRVIPDRAFLEQKFAELTSTYQQVEVLPLPPFWGGYRLVPRLFEFWQGRESRLHDRIQYQKKGRKWEISRLSP